MKFILVIIFITFSLHSHALTGLKLGTKSPKVILKEANGNIFDSTKLSKKIVYVFYRGSWCPYCVKQIKNLNSKLYPLLDKKEIELVAISVDRQSKTYKMKKEYAIKFPVLSDTKALSLKQFNIINQLSKDLVEKYKSAYSIDIEGDSGQKHHMIAHPAVIIVNKKGRVILNDVHTDYKQRTSIKIIKQVLGL